MSESGQSGRQATQLDYQMAISMYRGGLPPEAIRGKLMERGLSEVAAEAVVSDVILQVIYADAADLLNQGLSPEEVKQRLVEKGLEPEAAAAVVEGIVAQNRGGQTSAGRVLLKLVGGVVFVIGIGLFIGNVTGIFPTFPLAGFLVMFVGGAIWGAGEKS